MAKTGKPIKPVVFFHPGEMLSEKLQEMGLSNNEFADIVGLTEREVNLITSCKADVNEQNAPLLEKGTKIPQYLWLDLQENYTLYKLNRLAQSIMNNIKVDKTDKKQKIKRAIGKMSKLSQTIA